MEHEEGGRSCGAVDGGGGGGGCWAGGDEAANAMACLLAAVLASLEATATAASCWHVDDAVEYLFPKDACFCRTLCRLALLVACWSC